MSANYPVPKLTVITRPSEMPRRLPCTCFLCATSFLFSPNEARATQWKRDPELEVDIVRYVVVCPTCGRELIAQF